MPTAIREFARASAGEVGSLAAGIFSSGVLVTAVQNGSGNLELILWDPDAANRILSRGQDSGTQAGEVGEIALAMMGQRCLTAVQNANGYLLLIPWALESDGTISRLEVADHQAGKASYLSITPLNETLAITAVRNGAGNLLLIPWSVDATTGHVSRLNNDSAQGGSVSSSDMPQPPLTPAPEGSLIVSAPIDASNVLTAKVNASRELELAAWELNADFSVSRWAQESVGGLTDLLCMAPLGNPGDFVLVHRNTTIGQFSIGRECIATIWRVSKVDQKISQVAEASAGDMAAVGIVAGVIEPGGRPMVLLSARWGGTQLGDNPLVHTAFQLISNSTGPVSLVRTGQLDDSAYKYIFGTVPVSLEPGRFATAIGHESGLGVVAYNVSDLSATLIRPFAEATAGNASAIRVRSKNLGQAIIALRNGSGNLELIGWQLAARDFAISRAADTASHPIAAQEVALVVIGQRAVTAIQSTSGRLRLDSWDLAADLSSINPLHETGTAAGNADLITATVLEPDLVVTAVRNASRNLLIIVWRLEPDGTLSRLNHENAQAGEIDEVDLATLDGSNVMTAVRNGSGHLQIIGWHIDTNGSVTRWASDGHAGDVSALALAPLDGTGSTRNIVTAVRDGSNQLLLIAWQVSIDDRTVTRLADSGDQGHDGDISDLSLCVVQSPPSGREIIVTALRRESGNLKLASWQLLDDPSGIPILVKTGEMTNRADTDVRFTDCCPLEAGRIAVAAMLDSKSNDGLSLSTMQVIDAQVPAAPANILELSFSNQIPSGTSWASGSETYPWDKSFEWAQVMDPNQEYDDTPIGASGWIVAPDNSGADVPFSHPFGFDWEFSVALDTPWQGLLSPANADPDHNPIALADQLGLKTPEGLLGLEWDIGLLPASYRGQVNHGDRVAVVGRWILDQGHAIDGFYRTEIHPPLLLASAAVVQPLDRSPRRTRVLLMSRPFLSGQTYTTNLDTRYQDGVDDDGPLLNPHFSSHAFKEILRVMGFGSGMLEAHPKIKSKPFRGSHSAKFVVRPPGPRPVGAELLVSYRFTVRAPWCSVAVEPLSLAGDALMVTVELQESDQPPDLPPRHEETYSTDDLDLLSSGAGDQLSLGEHVVQLVAAVNPFYEAYVTYILGRGLGADVLEPLPDIDVLDPSGGISDVPIQNIVAGSGIVTDKNQAYPITGWLEAFWVTRSTRLKRPSVKQERLGKTGKLTRRKRA